MVTLEDRELAYELLMHSPQPLREVISGVSFSDGKVRVYVHDKNLAALPERIEGREIEYRYIGPPVGSIRSRN